jgi:hypothetical protein
VPIGQNTLAYQLLFSAARWQLLFYFMKICQTVNNSTTTEARENITTDLGSLELQNCLAEFRKY